MRIDERLLRDLMAAERAGVRPERILVTPREVQEIQQLPYMSGGRIIGGTYRLLPIELMPAYFDW